MVRGYDYREDLRRLRRFIREQRPVLVGVDAGADALLSAGHRPDIVVVGEEGLAQGAAPASRAAPSPTRRCAAPARWCCTPTAPAGRSGSDRLERLGVRYQTLAAAGTSEDVALLLADVHGASLVVTVGTHATLDEFLDRQRSGLASTFLTRLRVGPKLVDAKSVPQLYAGRVRLWHLALVLLAGLVALAAAIAATPGRGRVVVGVHRRPVRRTHLDPRTVPVISFRYHIVSIVSVFLALAVGIALGGGPLKGEVDNTLVDQVKADRQTKASCRPTSPRCAAATRSPTSSPDRGARAGRRPARRPRRRPGGAADRAGSPT